MSKQNKKHLLEVIKESFRTALLGVLSYLLTDTVINTLVAMVLGDKMNPQLVIVISGVLTAFLRGIEKELHSENKMSLPF